MTAALNTLESSDMFSLVIGLVITLIIVGVLLWAVESLIPLDAVVKRVIQVVVVLCVLLYVLRFFGGF